MWRDLSVMINNVEKHRWTSLGRLVEETPKVMSYLILVGSTSNVMLILFFFAHAPSGIYSSSATVSGVPCRHKAANDSTLLGSGRTGDTEWAGA